MKYWFFWFINIWFYASVVFATSIDEALEGKAPYEILFRAHLRKVSELNLKDRSNPIIFVSYSWDSEAYKRRIHTLCEDLEKAGIPANQILFDQWANRPGGAYDLHQFMERIPNSDKVLLFGSPELKRKYEEREVYPEDAGIVSHEINLLRNRVVARGVEGIMNVWFEGRFEDSFPSSLQHIVGRQLNNYSLKFFDLLWDIYQTIYPASQNPIMEIRDKFSVRKSRLRTSSDQTEFKSATGSFPQSLRTYNAFLDRTNDQGLSYLDIIFEELFMNEDEKQFSTLTLCAHIHPQEITLSGMGGVGKTTLATEFAHKYGVFYDLIYWLGGGSREELLRSCLSLLGLLEISIPERRGAGEETYTSNIIQLINESLSKPHQHSLLIIDNIEDPVLVAEFAPLNGHILYTSRHNDWFRKLDIDVFKREESIALLLQLTGLNPIFADQAGILAEELGDLPLALAQAAAYIKQQRLLTFEGYLDIYRESQADLLARQQIQSSLNRRTAVVMTTWNATMRALTQKAQQLMSYCAYLAPTAISVQLFNGIEGAEESLEKLTLYSMIQQESDPSEISVHRLVQYVTRENQKENKLTIQKTFNTLAELFLSSLDFDLSCHEGFFEKGQYHLSAIENHIIDLIKESTLEREEIINAWILCKLLDYQFSGFFLQKGNKTIKPKEIEIADSVVPNFLILPPSDQTDPWKVEEEFLSEILPQERLILVGLIRNIIGEIQGHHLVVAANTLRNIPMAEREQFCVFLRCLITPPMEVNTRVWMMQILEDISSEKREQFINESKFIYEDVTDPSDISTYVFTFAAEEGYLNYLASQPPTDDENSDSEEEQFEVFSPTESAPGTINFSDLLDQLHISEVFHKEAITIFSKMSSEEIHVFSSLVNSLYTLDMDEGTQFIIIKTLAEMKNNAEREAFINRLKEIPEISGWEKSFIITSLYELTELDDKIYVINKSQEILDLRTNSQLEKLINSFRLTFIIKLVTQFLERANVSA